MSTAIFDATAQSAGTIALAHEKILRAKIGGVFVNITGDANNVAGVPTPVPVTRENYGNKGLPSSSKLGDSWVITWDVEAVRNDSGLIVQAWLVSLLNVAKATGAANKIELQLFDGKDEALGAIQGTFSLSRTDLSTGYADKGGYQFTATSDGVVADVASPVAGTGVPILESATPTLATVGDLLVVRGYNLTGTVSATIDTISVAEFSVVDDYTLVILIPATVAGSAPIIVTNAIGASTALPYTAA